MNPDKLQIKVTQEHIDKGTKAHCKLCPIALAVQEMFPAAEVTVSIGHLTLDNDLYHIPAAARNFIIDFDREDNVAMPVEFETTYFERDFFKLDETDSGDKESVTT